MGDLFEEYLLTHWGQTIKPDSKEVLIVHGSAHHDIHSSAWKVLTQMTTLGIVIDWKGSIAADFSATIAKMWRAFWANAGQASLKKAPLKAKLALLKRATLSVADMHFVYWPFTRARASQLDRTQLKMLASLARLRPNIDDTAETFWKRRRMHATKLQAHMGSWSFRWAKRVVKWDEHLRRATTSSLPSQLVRIRTADDLQQRRWKWNRPCVRAVPGAINARYSESVEIANTFSNL